MEIPIKSEDLENRAIFLVLSPAASIRESNISIIRRVSALGYSSLVVTTNFPYHILEKLYVQNGVDMARVMFIDAVTKYSMGSVENIPGKVWYISNPADLTDMGIAVTELLKDAKGKKVCLIIDSISTMLIYLSSANISKFIHFLSNKIRLMDISGIFLAAEKGLDPQLQMQLTTFVDQTIELPD